MKKTISMDELKVMLRETGVRVKPSYDHGSYITVSSALKKEHQVFLNKQKRIHGFKSGYINQLIRNFKPIKKDIFINLKHEEAKSTVGFLGKRISKVFGTRKNVKFTAFCINKPMYHKLNELSEYYGISRSSMFRFILDQEMNK